MSPREREALLRRRRLTALAVIVAAVAVGVIVSASPGSGPRAPRYLPGGVGPASVLTVPGGSGAGGSGSASGGFGTASGARRAAAFTPAPAALRAASTLSLSQQVAQLFLVSLAGPDAAAVAGLGPTEWGGVVFDASNFVSPGQVGALAGDVLSAFRAAGGPLPLLAAAQAGGAQTAFRGLPPESEAAIGAGGNPARARDQALRGGRALRGLGFTMTLAPLADVDNLSGALSGRLFGTDPTTVARLSLAALAGYARAAIIAAPGHFPGEGAASADPAAMAATVGGSLASLRARDLVPFAALAPRAQVIVMSNAEYAAFDGVTPAGLLPAAVRLLRDAYGFRGVVMSDDLDATLQPTGATAGTVAVEALAAGDDLLYISGPPSEHLEAYRAVLAAAEQSAAVRRRVRDALLHDLTLKARAGLLH